MLQSSKAFSGFSVANQNGAYHFYADVLGLHVGRTDDMGGMMHININRNDNPILVHPKPHHQLAQFEVNTDAKIGNCCEFLVAGCGSCRSSSFRWRVACSKFSAVRFQYFDLSTTRNPQLITRNRGQIQPILPQPVARNPQLNINPSLAAVPIIS